MHIQEMGFLSSLLCKWQSQATFIGKAVLPVLLLIRMVILGAAAQTAWVDDEQDFECDTQQPGCSVACYNEFTPVSAERFWTLQGDTSSTKYQVELGDGVRAIYQNLTVTDEPIQHRYKTPGIYKVTVKAGNMAGHDEATMYIQVTAPLQEVHLKWFPLLGGTMRSI